MKQRLSALFFLGLSLVAATACARKREAPTTLPPTTGQTEVKPDVVTETPVSTTAAPNQFHKTLTGTLDNRLDIEMELERSGQKLTGSYFYENVRDYIELEGTVDNGGSAKIKEMTDGKATGVFNGRLNGEERNGVVTLRFEGTWSNARGDKQMPFSLREKSFALSNGMKFASKTMKEASKKDHYEIEAE